MFWNGCSYSLNINNDDNNDTDNDAGNDDDDDRMHHKSWINNNVMECTHRSYKWVDEASTNTGPYISDG